MIYTSYCWVLLLLKAHSCESPKKCHHKGWWFQCASINGLTGLPSRLPHVSQDKPLFVESRCHPLLSEWNTARCAQLEKIHDWILCSFGSCKILPTSATEVQRSNITVVDETKTSFLHQGTTGITWSLNGNRTLWLSHQWRRGWTNQGWWRRPPALAMAIAKRDRCYQFCVLVTCILVGYFKFRPKMQNMTWIHSCLHFRSYKSDVAQKLDNFPEFAFRCWVMHAALLPATVGWRQVIPSPEG